MAKDDYVVLQAPAKINLTLEVLGRRPDGYHEIRSVLHALELHDTLRARSARALRLTCSAPHLVTADNLVLVAARRLQERVGVDPGAEIHLTKRIPESAGLGGGSSDAAAALRALNHLWGLGLSRSQLSDVAATVGSDVPFFLDGPAALATGRGVRLAPLAAADGWVLLVRPPLELERKTARLYGALTTADFSDGTATEALVSELRRQLSIVRSPAHRPSPGTLWATGHSSLVNTFDGVAMRLFPELGPWGERLRESGAVAAHLAGSGPTWYGLFASWQAAKTARRSLSARGAVVLLTRLARVAPTWPVGETLGGRGNEPGALDSRRERIAW
ncbi:MAG: 4-(cytidine 5'-diphospho)-2-C-methyl-D-erythritol kinase [Chloroflexi bacterium]|nr:4-(cytidine 5'-diphospho)-2-C-methyl-D-erythritol kinase [Chloroflexota bacterium]